MCKFTQKILKIEINLTLKENIITSEAVSAPVLSGEPDICRLYPPMEDVSRLLAACLPADYSASRIARAVEDADARLLNLNVTTDGLSLENRVVFELRVNHRSPLAVARSLERYGYDVLDVDNKALAEDALTASRLAELMRVFEL